eukprot:344030-Amphidinium_carterae.1
MGCRPGARTWAAGSDNISFRYCFPCLIAPKQLQSIAHCRKLLGFATPAVSLKPGCAEVSEAKALMEQVALVCSGRPFYKTVLEYINNYVMLDLRRLDVCSQRAPNLNYFRVRPEYSL